MQRNTPTPPITLIILISPPVATPITATTIMPMAQIIIITIILPFLLLHLALPLPKYSNLILINSLVSDVYIATPTRTTNYQEKLELGIGECLEYVRRQSSRCLSPSSVLFPFSSFYFLFSFFLFFCYFINFIIKEDASCQMIERAIDVEHDIVQ
jgi:hypothetical protein